MAKKRKNDKSYRQQLISQLKPHKLLTVILVTIGAVLVWKGLWDALDQIPLLQTWFIPLCLGLLLLWFINRYDNLI